MIKINDNECEIQGKGVDIVQEFCCLIRVIREEQPEMLTGVLVAWMDILMKDSCTMDRKLANSICHVAESWIELNEVE